MDKKMKISNFLVQLQHIDFVNILMLLSPSILYFTAKKPIQSNYRLRKDFKIGGVKTVDLPFDTAPEIEMASTAGKTILLNCEEPVELGTTRDDATIFWMVVPPTDFTDGFTLLVSTPDGDVFIKETHKPLTIDRNGVLRIFLRKALPHGGLCCIIIL